KWFVHDPKRWTEFQRRYRAELRTRSGPMEQIRELERAHGTVTLIYSARDDRGNQAVVLCAALPKSR
ncbi:MAG: DUF488 domain-containing protein, partial [Candidatus Acidiferrales bacterium]